MASRNDACSEPSATHVLASAIGNTIMVTGHRCTLSDNEIHRFNMTDSCSWVHADLTDLQADYALEVQNGDGAALGGSHNGATCPEALDLALQPGTYYLLTHSRIAVPNNDSPYSFGLSIAPRGGGTGPSGKLLLAEKSSAPGEHFHVVATADGYEVGCHDGEYVGKLSKSGKVESLERSGQILSVV